MKKYICLYFCLIPLLLTAQPPQTQEFGDGLAFVKAIALTLARASVLESNSSFGFTYGTCLLGAFIRESNFVKFNMTLQAGAEYALIGGGDDDATDIDIVVKNSAGMVVVEDRGIDNNPVVRWRAGTTGTYTFQLTLHSCAANGSFCAMTIMKQYANTLPTSNMSTALANSYRMWRTTENLLNIKFHDKQNQWCLFGNILSPNDNQTVTNLDMGTLSHVLISAADNNARDIDLCITNNQGQALECDQADDPRPVVQYNTNNSYYYGVKTKNISSNGRSFIITSIMTN